MRPVSVSASASFGKKFPHMEPKSVPNPDPATDPANSVPAVYRLLAPVNAGVSAARHLAWYIRYHAASQQRPGR
jgi:hypothetical protein